MDFLKQAQGALGGAGGGQQAAQQGGAPANAQAGATGAAPGAAAGQQDALDKGIGSVLSSAGYGQSVGTTEKISDGVRSAFKSATGKDVPIQDKQ